MADEVVAHFFDVERIEFFVDGSVDKQGKLCLGKPICSPDELRKRSDCTILINSLEHEQSIKTDIANRYSKFVRKVIGISELLTMANNG